ncbi:DMT family transporter [Anaerotignum lactatifermentans]|uniref:DMT family transporter n=1 Tax=Anaerotignum lactatifermentans TaxID=160404 RepID=A0ABS2GA54_9FIRM|nr:DMT family transporter [Anaerotignum lactatifermentans]MBM6830285.1 DMT family transporter [Anaerotignum lactatifermentans]MBM6878339.1 DMT family transporter [Anaerotignum lactatifermentans]MBM6951494.1 DMT family transporter [Anaerotignum lactatifermentans]
MYSNLKTYLILFTGVFALSTSAIFARIAKAPSSITAFYRLFLAAAVLTPVLLLHRPSRAELKTIPAGQWARILAAGLFLALHYMLWFESLRYTSVASSTVLVCLQPLFSLAFERLFSKKRIKKTALLGCIIALCGSAVIGSGDFRISGSGLRGDLLAFVAAGVIALYFFVGERVRKELSAVTYSSLSYFFSALLLLLYSLAQKEPFFGYSGQTWLAFGGLAVISTIGGQFVFNLLLRRVPASAVTMSILGEPIGTCILAYFILRETILPQQFCGMVIIFLGMVIFFFPSAQKSERGPALSKKT